MNIFVVNSGSSSIKYQLFSMPKTEPLCSGLVERIGLNDSVITHKVYQEGQETVHRKQLPIPEHEKGLQDVVSLLTDAEIGVLRKPEEVEAVGHRVVHGGESFAATTTINQKVKEEIKRLFALAPLHNPSNYLGIEVAERIFSKATQVAVFDTAFHQTMPEKAYRYAIPNSFYTQEHIRAYGFHGTSHKYVSRQAALYLEKPEAKLISIHLGNGCSMAAVTGGKSVDTSMGFGPLGGLIMGTRSGDIDPAIIFHLIQQKGLEPAEVNNLLNKQSGMKGLTGYSDMRDIGKAADEGNSNARLAYELYTYRIKKYIGAYAAAMNGVDALVFTAGVGENDARTRALVCREMEFLGIQLDEEKNSKRAAGIREINKEGAAVKVLVVPTNEELEIAQQCFALLKQEG